MKKIAIVGSGGFAREILTLINDINRQSKEYEFVGFVGLDKNQTMHGYPVIGNDEEINKTTEPISLIIAVGEPNLKEKIRLKYTNP